MVAVRKWVEDTESPIAISQSLSMTEGIADSSHDGAITPIVGKCNAKKKNRTLCGANAGAGTNHPGIGCCKWHGGAMRNHVTKARRILLEQEMATYGIPIETTPEQGLMDEINRCAGHVAWLLSKVQSMTDEQLVWGPAEARRLERTSDVSELSEDVELFEVVMKAGANVWLKLYQEERKNLRQACGIALKQGIEERRVRLAERQGMQLSLVFRAFCEEMQLDQATMYQVPEALRRALERVMGGAQALTTRAQTIDVPLPSVLDQA